MENKQTPDFCVYDGSDYQQAFWDQGNRAYEDGSEQLAFKKLLPPGGKRMLEIGAGAGRNTTRYRGYEKIYLMDYALTQMQEAQRRLGKSDRYVYVAADVYSLPFNDNVFDGATMIRVLHHLSEIDPAFAQIQRVMAKNSLFILEYANKRNLKAILRWLLSKQDWNPFTRESIEFVEGNSDNHPAVVEQSLKAHGFRAEKTLSVSNLRIASLKQNPKNLSWMLSAENILQDFAAPFKLSPSVFMRLRQTTGEALDLSAPVFKCPVCGSISMEETAEAVICSHCGREYPIVDGIYNFRIR